MYRPGWVGYSNGHRFGDSARTHGDHSGHSNYRRFGRRRYACLEQQRCKGLRRFGRVERQQKYKWLAYYRSDLGKLDLYVDLRRLRPTSSAVRHGNCGIARPDGSLEREPEYGGERREFDAQLVGSECHLVQRLWGVVWSQADERLVLNRRSDCRSNLHADLYRCRR